VADGIAALVAASRTGLAPLPPRPALTHNAQEQGDGLPRPSTPWRCNPPGHGAVHRFLYRGRETQAGRANARELPPTGGPVGNNRVGTSESWVNTYVYPQFTRPTASKAKRPPDGTGWGGWRRLGPRPASRSQKLADRRLSKPVLRFKNLCPASRSSLRGRRSRPGLQAASSQRPRECRGWPLGAQPGGER